MKNIIIYFIFIISSVSLAQNDCRYTEVKLGENKKISVLRTDNVMVESTASETKGRVVDFGLLNVEGRVVLNVEIYSDSKKRIEPSCIGSDAEMIVSLQNGKKIALPQIGQRLCGEELESNTPGFFNIRNRASFLITEDKFEDLLKNEMILIKINSVDFNLNFVVRGELYNDENEKMLHPGKYFMQQLKCVVNPTIEVGK
ncbi:MAG: hypothetical protein ACQESK_07240 [Bacteroidota bacterium]